MTGAGGAATGAGGADGTGAPKMAGGKGGGCGCALGGSSASRWSGLVVVALLLRRPSRRRLALGARHGERPDR
jgi:hypothetical protein